MRVYENEDVEKDVIRRLGQRGTRRFRKRWSVTKLVCCSRSAYWWRTGTEWKPDDPDSLQLTFTRGRAHHEILEVYKDKEIYLRKDEITGHVDTKGERIIEIFTTMVGTNRVKAPEDAARVFSIKVAQLKCYLCMSGDTSGDLMVFHLMGDYSRPIKPKLKVFTFDFEPVELEKWWESILKRREHIEECARIGRVPLEMGESYECLNCGYRYKCVEFLQERYEMAITDYIEALKNEDVVL